MKLSQFLSALVNAEIQVDLIDLDTNTEIASIKASGYTALQDSIENREVKQWSILGVNRLKVVLGDVIA